VHKDYQLFNMDLSMSQVPYLKTTMVIAGSRYPKSLMFDMGATGCLFLNYNYVAKNSLNSKMKIIGDAARTGAGSKSMRTQTAKLPWLQIGKFKLRNLPVNIQVTKGYNNSDGEELGMEVLRRFNCILDYQNNVIYLAPNHLFHAPFRQLKN
jgi:hypothetical protein